MKVLASNDTMQILKLGIADSERPQIMSHNLQMLDQRADWTLRLLQSWGLGAVMGDILEKYACDEHKRSVQPVPPQELVMRICEVVDAAWNEMLHRGWIVTTGPIGD